MTATLVSLPSPVARTLPIHESLEKAPPDQLVTLRRLVWLYLALLIFEGALRKWILPGLANPLLVIRDPVVLLIYGLAMHRGLFPWKGFVVATIVLAAITGLVSEMAGQGTFIVTLFGLRTNFLHLPLIFVLPKVFDERDLEKLGKVVMLSAFPMALLVLAQFKAPGESWLNRGVGGTSEGMLDAGFGRIRPPGTFSFTTGLFSYLSLCFAFVLHALMRKDAKVGKLALAALPATAAMVGVSGSRSTLGAMAVLLAGVVGICVIKPAFFGRALKGLVFLGVVYLGLSAWSEFRSGLEVHEGRLVDGGGLMDGLVYRVFNDFTAPVQAIPRTPAFGYGLGMGTNFAAGLLFGERRFLLAEGEWERMVAESGAILGFAGIGLRILLVIYVARKALAALRHNDPLPLLLFLAVGPTLLNGQFGVPTTLGFSVLGAGLTLSAARRTEADEPAAELTPNVQPVRQKTGRSIYAEKLHAGR